MNLTATTHSLELVTGQAVSLDWTVDYTVIDRSGASQVTTPASAAGNAATATDTTVVAAPSANVHHIVTAASFRNAHASSTQTVTVQKDVGGTEYPIISATLAAGEALTYEKGQGWTVRANTGQAKTISSVAGNVTNAMNVVVLAADVINNNAVANTIADVTGLNFPVVAGETYWFEFVIPYTSAATTTGSRWTISGPAAPTMLNYTSEYTLAATTKTTNNATAYDIPAASNASSLTVGNVATIWGVIKPSSNGIVTARFASEILNSAITAKAGAVCRWMRVL